MLTLVGSTAWEIKPTGRVSHDTDLVGTYDEVTAWVKEFVSHSRELTACYPADGGKKLIYKFRNRVPIEAEIAWEGTTAAELCELVKRDPATVRGFASGYSTPSLNVLYMLKMSHRYLKNSPHFLKTMRDIQAMRRQGAVILPEHMDFFKRREAETYSYAHPKLNVMKNDFFKGDGVQYVYDHDTVHESVKHLDRPAYTYYMKDGAQVQCDKEKFLQ